MEPGSKLPEIPCFCEPNHYDKKGFFGYPERQGWEVTAEKGPLFVGEANNYAPSDPAALLQVWLVLAWFTSSLKLLRSKSTWKPCSFVMGNTTHSQLTLSALTFTNVSKRERKRAPNSFKPLEIGYKSFSIMSTCGFIGLSTHSHLGVAWDGGGWRVSCRLTRFSR